MSLLSTIAGPAAGFLLGNFLTSKKNGGTRSSDGRPALVGPDQLESALPQFEQRLSQTMTGVNPWTRMQLTGNAMNTQNMVESAMNRSLAAEASARSNLAMRGGLSGGAAERLAGQSRLAGMAGAQEASRQGAINALEIGSQGFDKGMQGLSTWANMASGDVNARNNLLVANNALESQMWAAKQAANAQRDTAKNTGGLFGQGGFLGTGLFR